MHFYMHFYILQAGGLVQVAVVGVGGAVGAADRVGGGGAGHLGAGHELLAALLQAHGVHSASSSQAIGRYRLH